MGTKKLQIVTPIVTSVNGQTGDVTLDTSGGGSMKKLTFTGGATGEYDGSSDMSVAIPEDKIYIMYLDEDADKNLIFTNDYDEAKAAYESGKIFGLRDLNGAADIFFHVSYFKDTEALLFMRYLTYIIGLTWTKATGIVTPEEQFDIPLVASTDFTESGVIYWDKDQKEYILKDTSYKAGNGISISDDGTISVTAAKIYSGNSTPADSLGENGDIYIQTEG